jgi:hypothetical protein
MTMPAMKKCSECGKEITRGSHQFGEGVQCCRCYVLLGNPPADWHSGCMSAYYELHPDQDPGKKPETTA